MQMIILCHARRQMWMLFYPILKNDCHISLKWFDDNGMKANPSKFKFMMIISSEYIEPQELMISGDVFTLKAAR